jgi:DNA/RNA endonuclease YhcR with UshA esterase domain
MKKTIRKVVLIFSILLLAGIAGIWYFIFYRPTHYQRNVLAENSVSVTADELVNNYETNEHKGDSLFLNKAVTVTGKVTDVRKNQEGKTIIFLESKDPMSNVSCTLQSPANITTGNNVTLKGVCAGYLSDVILIDGVHVK